MIYTPIGFCDISVIRLKNILRSENCPYMNFSIKSDFVQ